MKNANAASVRASRNGNNVEHKVWFQIPLQTYAGCILRTTVQCEVRTATLCTSSLRTAAELGRNYPALG